MDMKDAVIGAAVLGSLSKQSASIAEKGINIAQLEADTARIRSETELNTQRALTRQMETLTNMRRESSNQQEMNQLSRENIDLSNRLEQMEAEMTEMRAMMKEWVSSQRGLLALAKELKKEIDTCPNKEHHVLKDTTAVKKIAEDAADIAFADANDNGIPSKLPVYSPSWRK